MKFKNLMYIIVFLVLQLNLNCGKDEPLEPSGDKQDRKKKERFNTACYGIMATWFGSCDNADFKVKGSKYCQDLYYSCVIVCSAGNPVGLGCGF